MLDEIQEKKVKENRLIRKLNKKNLCNIDIVKSENSCKQIMKQTCLNKILHKYV